MLQLLCFIGLARMCLPYAESGEGCGIGYTGVRQCRTGRFIRFVPVRCLWVFRKVQNMGRGLVNMKAYGILGCTSLCSMGISMAVDCLLLLVFTYCRVCLSVLDGTKMGMG